MSKRFDAEQLIRDAASGDFPDEGNVLIRGADGWFFGNLEDVGEGGNGDGGGGLTFDDISGILDDRFKLPSQIAYEDEVNVFLFRNTFSDLRAPDLEAYIRFSRK